MVKNLFQKTVKQAWTSANVLGICVLSLTAVGCGKSDSTQPPTVVSVPGPVTPGNGCPAGQYKIAEGVCAATFEQACASAGGLIVGNQICRTEKAWVNYSFSGLGWYPRLTSGDPLGYSALPVFNVRAGDTLNYSGTGKWGSINSHEWRWGPFYVVLSSPFHNTCGQVAINGMDEDGDVLTYPDVGGLPAGLVASDGVETFPLGYSVSNKIIQHTGVLKIGFNTPYDPGSCATAFIRYIRVSHCENTAGGTVTCP